MRDLLGGKGANVAEMTGCSARSGSPPASRSPPRPASPTCAPAARCRAGLEDEVSAALARLQERAGRALGNPDDPLLVSVRSGAASRCRGCSTPSSTSVSATPRSRASPRRPATSASLGFYRRFAQMFGNVCRGIPGERYEELIAAAKRDAGGRAGRRALGLRSPAADRPLQVALLQRDRLRVPAGPGRAAAHRDRRRLRLLARRPRRLLPADQRHPRGVGHRGQRQQMVFGNKGERSCSGSPSPATRSPAPPSRAATSWSTPRARTSSPASAPRATWPRWRR